MSNAYTTYDNAETIVRRLHESGWITDELRDELLHRARNWPRRDADEIERHRDNAYKARLLVEGEVWPVRVSAAVLDFHELYAQGLCGWEEADKWRIAASDVDGA